MVGGAGTTTPVKGDPTVVNPTATMTTTAAPAKPACDCTKEVEAAAKKQAEQCEALKKVNEETTKKLEEQEKKNKEEIRTRRKRTTKK